MIGERIDVGDIRVADHDVDEALVGANILRLADRHRHGRGARRVGKRNPLLRLRHCRHERKGRHQCRRKREADCAMPLRAIPRLRSCYVFGRFVLARHVGLPAVAVRPQTEFQSAPSVSLRSRSVARGRHV
jgi:hypothetical protein